MRSDKIADAIGKIDPSLVAKADGKGKTRKKVWYISAIAAVLAVAVCFGLFGIIGKNTNGGGSGVIPGTTPGTIPGTTLGTTPGTTPGIVQRPPLWTDGGEAEDYDPATYLKYLLLSAKYPVMAKYPGANSYGTQEYEAWRNGISKQREYRGAGENLDEFFTKTITEFLSGHGENNAVYSPLNVYFALAMLAEISDDNRRQQVLDLLGAENIEELRAQAYAIWNTNYMDEGTVKSILASSVWLDEAYFFNEDMLNILKEYYYSSIFSGDFGTDEINFALRSWLNEQTGGLADKLSDIELDPDSAWAIATTIYFSAKWSSEFYDALTTKGIFHSPVGNIECDFMNNAEYGDYYWGEKFGAIGKYLANSGSMYFILPNEGVSIDELLSDSETLSFISGDNNSWNNSKNVNINFSVPKFDVQSDMDLLDGLEKLGIETGDISSALHGAGVKIDEKGIIASAFTVIVGDGSIGSTETVDFVLDRPFIFVITGTDGLPLFVGVVNQP